MKYNITFYRTSITISNKRYNYRIYYNRFIEKHDYRIWLSIPEKEEITKLAFLLKFIQEIK